MPATVVANPLSVRFEFASGPPWTEKLEGLPNAQLAADFAVGLALSAHPRGGIGSKVTAQHYGWVARRAVRELVVAGFIGCAADLRRHHLLRLMLAGKRLQEMSLRKILEAFDSATGALHHDVRTLVGGRLLKAQTVVSPLEPYSDAEWRQTVAVCQDLISQARQRQHLALKALQHPADSGHSYEHVLYLVATHGPLEIRGLTEHLGLTFRAVRETDAGKLLGQAREALFPTREVTIAYQVLFATQCGIVPDGIAGLGLGDIEWAGDTDILLSYVKGRTGREGLHLPKRAASVLSQWLAYSQLLRDFAGETLRNRLWLYTFGTGWMQPPLINELTRNSGNLPAWARRHSLTGDDGSPLDLRKARIRTTYQSLLGRRGWTGRTTIDPNHTAAVEGDHYLTVTTPAQADAVSALIEEGQQDLLRKALPAVVVDLDQAADLAAALPSVVARLELDDAAIRELVGGQRDVFTAACANQLASPHGPAGKPCPARPWVCLLCPLAVFLPRHAPNLLRLKAFFARQFAQMPSDQFLQVFGLYAQRLDAEILPQLHAGVLDAAASQVSNDDSEIPLRPEEITG